MYSQLEGACLYGVQAPKDLLWSLIKGLEGAWRRHSFHRGNCGALKSLRVVVVAAFILPKAPPTFRPPSASVEHHPAGWEDTRILLKQVQVRSGAWECVGLA